MRAVFLDRDGTITVGIPRIERVDSLDKVELLPTTMAALSLLAKLNFGVFIVTNQAGINEGLITVEQFHEINNKILELIAPSGITVLKTYFSPLTPDAGPERNKPSPAMLLEAAAEFNIDLADSWMIGDRPSDIICGIGAGTKAILVKSGDPNSECPEATITLPSILEAVDYIAQLS